MKRFALSLLLVISGLVLAPAPSAEAQTRDRIQRIDRMERARERAAHADRARAATRDRSTSDRATSESTRERAANADEPDTTERGTDQTEETASSGASSSDGMIVLGERGQRYRRGEVLGLNMSAAALELARSAGVTIVRRRVLDAGNVITVLRGRKFDNPEAIIAELKTLDPAGIYTPNHVYGASSEPQTMAINLQDELMTGLANLPAAATYRVGMIDGRPDRAHPMLAELLSQVRDFTSTIQPPSLHGTAVALRMRETQRGHAPGATLDLYAAGVLSGGEDQWAAADALAAAIAWQHHNDVAVLNISLAGPPNEIVEALIAAFQRDGGQVVAAVGNGGPLSANIYPAAYADVIGVTAVDNQGQVYALATRGEHVDLAAPGVALKIAGLETQQALSGTSFAAPLVSVWLLTTDIDTSNLAAFSIDRGAAGRDDLYGWGELTINPISVTATLTAH